MKHRDRVRAALRHKEPDRVPLDIGSTDVTGIHWRAYVPLCTYLGVEEGIHIWDPIQGLATVSNKLRERLGIDTFGVWLNATLTPCNSLDGRPAESKLEIFDMAPFVVDEWGTVFRLPEHRLWYEPVRYPLFDATLRTLDNHDWPDPSDERKMTGVVERARWAHEETDYAVVANFSGALLARGQLLRGPAQFLMELLTDPDLSAAILDRVLDYNIALVIRYLDAIRSYIDVIKVSDDLGIQTSLLISPKLYRNMIKPRHREFLETIRDHTDAMILYHSCGAVRPLISDFIEIGVDILNPIQVSAAGMDTAELAREYGGSLCFWGAVDNQRVLSISEVSENEWNSRVEEEVRQRLVDLGRGGGYICAPSHNIQPNTPPMNVLTLCKALQRWGTYPLEEAK